MANSVDFVTKEDLEHACYVAKKLITYYENQRKASPPAKPPETSKPPEPVYEYSFAEVANHIGATRQTAFNLSKQAIETIKEGVRLNDPRCLKLSQYFEGNTE